MKAGLYHPDEFKDNCGFGLIAHMQGEASHHLLQTAIEALTCMTHRGGINADGKTGDGCGLLMQKPDVFLRAAAQQAPADDLALLARLGLAGLEDIPCRMLSAGQQRRVSLARLWFARRQLWILDEPFTALDQGAIAMLQQHFLQHLQQGGAIVLTTHQSLSLKYDKLNTLELAYRW